MVAKGVRACGIGESDLRARQGGESDEDGHSEFKEHVDEFLLKETKISRRLGCQAIVDWTFLKYWRESVIL